MKTHSKHLLLMLALITFFSCKKDEEVLVDNNGLIKEITNFVPDSIIQKMKAMGMPINTGKTPPLITPNSIERKFRISNFTLHASNIPNEQAGRVFTNLLVTVKNQNNQKLTIEYRDEAEGVVSISIGRGSYIVGEGDMFSIFVDVQNTQTNTNSKADIVYVISGKLTEEGIKDLHYANFMINDYGDQAGVYMEVGQGRVIYDADRMSEFIE